MDQGRYGEEKDREESSYQGSYGAQAESWVCPACETVNTQDKCVVCGYQNEPKVDDSVRENKKRLHLVWAIAAAVLLVALCAVFIHSGDTYTYPIVDGAANTLMADPIPTQGTYTYPALGGKYQRRQISSITFLTSTEDAVADSWDVSENQDGTVLAWVKPNGKRNNMELYDLFIGAEGGVLAPKDCNLLFGDYCNLCQINFNDAFDTANVIDMGDMFVNCSSLTTLDVSSFDTSNVTNMGGTFKCCFGLTELDVSGIDTTNVTDMSFMFADCLGLTELDVSGIDTANVTDMGNMFWNCDDLSALDVSSFDTSKVTDMRGMFGYCNNLSALDVSGFDTSNVTNMRAMFTNCSRLTELDVSSFDVSNVWDCENFMDYGRTINGRPWEEFFRKQ